MVVFGGVVLLIIGALFTTLSPVLGLATVAFALMSVLFGYLIYKESPNKRTLSAVTSFIFAASVLLFGGSFLIVGVIFGLYGSVGAFTNNKKTAAIVVVVFFIIYIGLLAYGSMLFISQINSQRLYQSCSAMNRSHFILNSTCQSILNVTTNSSGVQTIAPLG